MEGTRRQGVVLLPNESTQVLLDVTPGRRCKVMYPFVPPPPPPKPGHIWTHASRTYPHPGPKELSCPLCLLQARRVVRYNSCTVRRSKKSCHVSLRDEAPSPSSRSEAQNGCQVGKASQKEKEQQCAAVSTRNGYSSSLKVVVMSQAGDRMKTPYHIVKTPPMPPSVLSGELGHDLECIAPPNRLRPQASCRMTRGYRQWSDGSGVYKYLLVGVLLWDVRHACVLLRAFAAVR